MAVVISEIRTRDLPAVGRFLHAHLNQRVNAQQWATAAQPPWASDAPNHGFLLRDGEDVVGAYLAFYSTRTVDAHLVPICNLAAWCVDERYRFHSLKLVKALLAQDGYTFVDLSPSGAVVPLNQRLGFATLDTATALVPALPWFTWPRRITITTDPAEIEHALSGAELTIYHDHVGAAAARHVLIRRGAEHCYVILRRDRRKNLPLFASVLHVSNAGLFRAAGRRFSRHLLMRHRVLALLAELRVVEHRPRWSFMLERPRPKMFKSATINADQVDYLYSELVCVGW